MATRTCRPTRRTHPIDSTVFAGLRAQWDTMATSRRFRSQLQEWSTRHPVLEVFADGEDLMAVAPKDRDVLEALAAEAVDDEMAMTATLVALLPRLAHMVKKHTWTGLDIDDRCAAVMAIAHETVVKCRPGTASSWYDRRLWCNISKRYNRYVDDYLSHTDAIADHLGALATDTSLEFGYHDAGVAPALADHVDPVGTDFELAELCDWVATRARVDLDTARLIVLTRAGGVPVEDLVGSEGLSAQSLRRRRLRAEKRLATALAAA